METHRLKSAVLKPLAAPARMRRASATARNGCRTGGVVPVGRFSRAKYGELHRVAIARTLRAFDFLPFGHHDALVARLTIVTNIFVNWHFLLLRSFGLSKPFDMASSRVSRHFPGLSQCMPARNEPRQGRNRYLKSNLQNRILTGRWAPLSFFPPTHDVFIAIHHMQVYNGENDIFQS